MSYPLPTLACTVNATGITGPSLNDIIASLQASYRSIYGSDVNLDNSTPDGQWIAIMAQSIYDSNQTCIAVYNQFSPATAQGAGLSSVVKVNGMTRAVASYSTAMITIVGQAGTVINGGLVGDDQNLGTQWALPTTATIPVGGSIDVIGTCTVAGAIVAEAATLTKILTPTAGWQSATNGLAAVPGAPIEADAALRQRQARSIELPTQTTFDGTVGALLGLSGVLAVGGYVNNSGTTDVHGVPPYAWSLVIDGGDAQQVIDIIGLKKTQGPPTYGNTSGTYTSVYGIPEIIHYSQPIQLRIIVAISLRALPGYSSAVALEIQTAVATYINSLGLSRGSDGQFLYITRLYAPALLSYAGYPTPAGDAVTYELTSLLVAEYGNPPGNVDIPIAYDEIAHCSVSDVSVTVL